jgi:YVTN family beta-propeller protein
MRTALAVVRVLCLVLVLTLGQGCKPSGDTEGYPDTIAATIKVGGTTGAIVGLAHHPYVYVTNEKSGVCVVNTDELRVVDSVACGADAWQLAASPDDRYIYVSHHYDSSVSVISTEDNSVVANVRVGDCPHAMACSPDGKRLYVANINDRNVSVIQTSDNTLVATVNVDEGPRGLCILPNGEYVYTANTWGSASVIRTSDNAVVKTIPVSRRPHRATASSDDRYVYISSADVKALAVIQTTDNTVVGWVTVGSMPFNGCGLPETDYVYIASGELGNDDEGYLNVIKTPDSLATQIRITGNCRGVTTSGSGDCVCTANGIAGTVSVFVRH